MDINPIEKREALLSFLKELGVSPAVYHSGDANYEYLQGNDCCIAVKNPHDAERDLFVDLEDDGEFTVSLHAWHEHYAPDDEEYEALCRDVRGILENQYCPLVVFAGEDWQGSTLVHDDTELAVYGGYLIAHMHPKENKKHKMKCIFWDPAHDREIPFPEEEQI